MITVKQDDNDVKDKGDIRTIVDEVRDVIDELRPFLHMDGGDAEFIRYDEEDKTVYVRMSGACAMCMDQDGTLEYGLLQALKDRVPEVENIVNVPL